MEETEYKYDDYFNSRKIDINYYNNFRLPKYILSQLPNDKNAKILDLGCGFGQTLKKIKERGYTNIFGIDISEKAVNFCKENGLDVELVDSIENYSTKSSTKFHFIIMSHVLEHIKKENIIDTLRIIREKLIENNGRFLLIVPNAQSNTGSYWYFEDFTHYTLFTSGSLYYVLKNAGYSSVDFIDINGTSNVKWYKRWVYYLFINLYRINKRFWNWVTFSHFHSGSLNINTFEIKAIAKP